MVAIIYSDEFLEHDTGSYHPENSGRLRAIKRALETAPWGDQLDWHVPTSTTARDVMPWLQKIHDARYIQALEKLAVNGGGQVDGDTVVSPRSYAVAQLAVNAWLDGVDQVLITGKPTFVLARPPGHHAIASRGMGFCLFSNAAIAAHYSLEQPNIQNVAILDWDVHHGNGTQAIVESNPRIAYCSLHQYPCYPGTGAATERGMHQNVLNIPMAPGSTLADYQPQFDQQVIPFLQGFSPDLLIVSAGYDANAEDPLASTNLYPSDYGIFTQQCLSITENILFGLEGGYDYDALAQSVLATIAPCLS